MGLGLLEEARREERGDDADRGVDQQGEPPAVDVQAEQVSVVPVSQPPSSRPTAAPTPDIAAYTAKARLRAGPAGNVVAIRASAAGEASAAPRPWRPRAASSSPSLVARPPSSEATPKIDEADHEDLAAAVEVTEPAAEQQQAAEGQRVAGDDPAQVGGRDVEVVLDVGQRDVHDGAVEHHHQLRHRDEHECPAQVLLLCPVMSSELTTSVMRDPSRSRSGGVGPGRGWRPAG